MPRAAWQPTSARAVASRVASITKLPAGSKEKEPHHDSIPRAHPRKLGKKKEIHNMTVEQRVNRITVLNGAIAAMTIALHDAQNELVRLTNMVPVEREQKGNTTAGVMGLAGKE
jgi:hypothetical protein